MSLFANIVVSTPHTDAFDGCGDLWSAVMCHLWRVFDHVVFYVFWQMHVVITLRGLLTSYGDIELDQHWLMQWHVAWRHQAITWANLDLSVRSSDINLRAIWQEIPQASIIWISWKISYLGFTKLYQWFNCVELYRVPQFCEIISFWTQILGRLLKMLYISYSNT